MLMVLKFSNTYKLPLTAISNLMSLINNVFESPILPESRYLIDTMFNYENKAQFHVVCPHCSNYLGKKTEIGNEINCNMCSSSINVSTLSSSNSFVILNPAKEISNLIQSHEDYYNYIVCERLNETGDIKDVYDGQYYKKFVNCLPADERNRYVTAVFNTDGAQRFESSQDSIWPILIQINELPSQFRLKNIITCAMWFGKSKPDMSTFLHIFVTEMNIMNEMGIECTIHGEKRMLKLYMLISCVDAVARAPMQGLVQFNAYNSCSWCLHPGKWHDGAVRFPILHYRPIHRDVCTIQNGQQAVTSGTVIIGVKTVTPLINIPHFDIMDGFVPDYLHCYLAGVAKQITDNECILKLVNKYDIEQLNSLLLAMKVPNQLCRLTRSLKERLSGRQENGRIGYYITVYLYLEL
ncbi:PREDICTED: uncharacterized protein LOC105564968 [Vollenhovia emeryi]|uniref:uncharacterized protein LOC105564968 n=1 Tax=Vollenhovia emeryi TaxID=411798 RepID=UPI0005F3E0AF|nr:PREDICTED: uncharacterized protein LOC105564968 [Vollenhovia emeryi]